MFAFAILTGPLGDDPARSEPIRWADVAICYDRGVDEQKPIVILFYDKTTSRVSADMVSVRLSLSPRIQAVASKASWCFGDVSSDLVSRNIAKALHIEKYPAISILAPNGNMLDESARVYDLSAQVDSVAFEEAAQKYIVLHVERLAAKYHGRP
jgi:hypothetical protein